MSKPTVSGPKIAPSKPPACTRPDAHLVGPGGSELSTVEPVGPGQSALLYMEP